MQNYVTAESAYVLVAPAGEAESVEALKPKYVLDKVMRERESEREGEGEGEG